MKVFALILLVGFAISADEDGFGTPPPCVYPVPLTNVAVGKLAIQSSTQEKVQGDAGKAVDANTTPNMVGGSCTETLRERNPSWMVDLGQIYDVYEVQIYNRRDCCIFRIKTAIVRVGYSEDFRTNPQCGKPIWGAVVRDTPIKVQCGCPTPMKGRYVSIQLRDVSRPLNLCEVKVMVG